MAHTKFKIFLSLILLPIAALCFYFGLRDCTMEEIVDMANDKCENVPRNDFTRTYCMVSFVDSYCNDNWKNKYCHEYQMNKIIKGQQ